MTHSADPPSAGRVDRPLRREKRARAAAITLTGLLGIVWAALIVSRYPNLLHG